MAGRIGGTRLAAVALGLLACSSLPPFAGVPAIADPEPPPASGAGAQEPHQNAPHLTLNEAIALALEASPELAAARAAGPVAEATIAQARERPNPELALEAEKETPKHAATFSFPLELAGKRGKRADLARAGLKSSEGEVASAEADVRTRVRRAFYELVAARRSEAEQHQSAALAERMREAARARFESGEAPRLEQLQAALVADQASAEALVSAGSTTAAAAALNVLLGRPPGAPVEPEGDLDGGSVPDPSDATSRALASSAELARLDDAVAEAHARIELARAQRVPDPTLEAAVTHDSEPDFTWGWRAGVSVTLPVFTTHRAAVAVEERSLDRAVAQRDAAAARIRADIWAATALASSRLERVRRYHDAILPQVVEIEGMAEEGYRAGETGLVAMLQSFQEIRQVRRDAIQAGLDFQTALADLESAMGTPLP